MEGSVLDISGAFRKAGNSAHTTYFLGRATIMSSISAFGFWVLFDAFCNERRNLKIGVLAWDRKFYVLKVDENRMTCLFLLEQQRSVK
jgi:hypothetical protein